VPAHACADTVFFALYKALMFSIELRHAPLFCGLQTFGKGSVLCYPDNNGGDHVYPTENDADDNGPMQAK
jgi:hypothetical protein